MLSQVKNSNYPLTSPVDYYSIVANGPRLDNVYSLRYRSYSERDYIKTCTSKKFMDEYDAMPNCKSFLTYYRDKLIGSIRSCSYEPEKEVDVPVMEVFKEELEAHIGYDSPFVEANKFVIDPSFQQCSCVKVRFNMFRNIVEEAFSLDARSIVIAVRPEHIKFYRMLYFYPVSEEKHYPHLAFKTVLLVCKNLEALKEKVWKKTER